MFMYILREKAQVFDGRMETSVSERSAWDDV